ncbi:MAG TPA: DNA polymerase III subunit delta [Gaiellaceae bacterium]|nr:DNA polymerase III subunit delta [Gaiellaceae bacterium]
MAPADLKPVYLLAGSDRPKVERAVERLRSHFGGDALERLSAAEASGSDAVAACNALGLFGGDGRLVLVEGVERWKAADAEAIAAYLASPAPQTVLALVGAEMKKDSPLAKACTKVGDVLVYDVARRGVASWVADQLARLGARADTDACQVLVQLVGDDLVELATEVDKLATWADGDEITQADVERLVAARAASPPFALTDAWGRRDAGAVLAACEAVLERGDGRGRASLAALVGRLYAHVARVQACRALDEEGVTPRDAAARLKMHPFAAEKALAQARNFSRAELEDAVVRLAELDRATKGGSRLPNELELERTLVDITRPRTPPPRSGGRRPARP